VRQAPATRAPARDARAIAAATKEAPTEVAAAKGLPAPLRAAARRHLRQKSPLREAAGLPPWQRPPLEAKRPPPQDE
jgi:hypothetical protein